MLTRPKIQFVLSSEFYLVKAFIQRVYDKRQLRRVLPLGGRLKVSFSAFESFR